MSDDARNQEAHIREFILSIMANIGFEYKELDIAKMREKLGEVRSREKYKLCARLFCP